MEHKALKVSESDNVAVALKGIKRGERVLGALIAAEDILAGHKVALAPIKKGEAVIKYGAPIGRATCDIACGAHVHMHNLGTGLNAKRAYTYAPQKQDLAPLTSKTFMGYQRIDGTVGIRNDLLILPTVGCVSGVARRAAARFDAISARRGIRTIALCHPYGCSQMAQDQENTRTILADLARHPNFGGVVLLGLGCENSGVETIIDKLDDLSRVRVVVAQEVEDELQAVSDALYDLLEGACGMRRTPVSTSALIVGLKCGGSDGLSGITANPVIGAFSDALIAQGGTTILTEVPEMFGAEQLLMNRCKTRALYRDAVALIEDFKAYYRDAGMPIDENPSPGNKRGGITTLEDKSLGCTQKAGTAPVCGVLKYGERAVQRGLNLLSAPGNDLIATTALCAAGAQLVLFSTGRGTPFMGPAPTVKISSNAPLGKNKPHWIDFDASGVLSGVPLLEMGDRLFEQVLKIASGEETLSEKAGYHDMAIFKNGVTL